MNKFARFLPDLLAGGADHKATSDIGGAFFSPVEDTEDALVRFQPIADRIIANDGLGYTVVSRLTHYSSDYGGSYIDMIVVNIPAR